MITIRPTIPVRGGALSLPCPDTGSGPAAGTAFTRPPGGFPHATGDGRGIAESIASVTCYTYPKDNR
jgi:hypothetical protein